MKTAELPPRCAKTRKATSWFGLGLFTNTIQESCMRMSVRVCLGLQSIPGFAL